MTHFDTPELGIELGCDLSMFTDHQPQQEKSNGCGLVAIDHCRLEMQLKKKSPPMYIHDIV